MHRKEAYRIAVEAEIRSQNLYKALAKSFKHKETKDFFAQLLLYEEIHEQKVRELYAREYPGKPLQLMQDLNMELQGVKLEDPKQVLEFAMSREELAQNIYLKLAEQSEDESTKALLKQFAAEELHHKELLFAELEKLHGILQWFDPSELNGLMEY
ncbi:MAG: ferritin family protein [Candidatus Cloacimonetes bacterium]|jgi:rubrerythrin|nr:ferritin family protein [Candidatus Cloacimonadota bacterium]MDD2506262.1 ferritin family protein [Candidatus Cloacimonadota bacterium]MDD4559315.1 ferritin family protein [Candidatus Cloacimonadota bacterium]